MGGNGKAPAFVMGGTALDHGEENVDAPLRSGPRGFRGVASVVDWMFRSSSSESTLVQSSGPRKRAHRIVPIASSHDEDDNEREAAFDGLVGFVDYVLIILFWMIRQLILIPFRILVFLLSPWRWCSSWLGVAFFNIAALSYALYTAYLAGFFSFQVNDDRSVEFDVDDSIVDLTADLSIENYDDVDALISNFQDTVDGREMDEHLKSQLYFSIALAVFVLVMSVSIRLCYCTRFTPVEERTRARKKKAKRGQASHGTAMLWLLVGGVIGCAITNAGVFWDYSQSAACHPSWASELFPCSSSFEDGGHWSTGNNQFCASGWQAPPVSSTS